MAELAVLLSWWILKDSHSFLHTFSIALYHKWGVKTGLTFAIQFVKLTSEGLGGVFLFLFHMQHFSFLECSSPLGQIICHHSLTHIASKVFLIESCGGLSLLLWDFGSKKTFFLFLKLQLISSPYVFVVNCTNKDTLTYLPIIHIVLCLSTLGSGINVPLCLLNLWLFSSGYGLIPDFIEII